jgi:polyribonucleotide nucleotidyltransferase
MYKEAYHELIRRYVRASFSNKHHRVDGRGLDDIRDITCEIDILPRAMVLPSLPVGKLNPWVL